MKKHLLTIIFVSIFVVGLSVLLYPTVSDYFNSLSHSRAIASYTDSVQNLDTQAYDSLLGAAEDYNAGLLKNNNRYQMTDDERKVYDSLLNINNGGPMGTLEIPSINVKLPIYHGTSEGSLQVGIGHLEGSSLPIGGPSTHAVISGHRGLPSATLLSNLDKVVVGDTFTINVLNETLTYEVDQIKTVLPDEMDALAIEPGKDLCTLVTCTPYGINTHRLLVRGHRIANAEVAKAAVRVPADAMLMDSSLVAVILAVPMLIGLFIFVLFKYRKRVPKSTEDYFQMTLHERWKKSET